MQYRMGSCQTASVAVCSCGMPTKGWNEAVVVALLRNRLDRLWQLHGSFAHPQAADAWPPSTFIGYGPMEGV